jgi:hypothetical protein
MKQMQISNNLVKRGIFFTYSITLIGLSLIIASSLFYIIKINSAPIDILPYIIHSRPSIFDWVYDLITLGIVLTIFGFISLTYIIFFKKDYKNDKTDLL